MEAPNFENTTEDEATLFQGVCKSTKHIFSQSFSADFKQCMVLFKNMGGRYLDIFIDVLHLVYMLSLKFKIRKNPTYLVKTSFSKASLSVLVLY